MTWLWACLGLILIIVVGAVLYGFFVARPRAQQRVTAATQAIAAELHGRQPQLLVPAQCRTASVREADQVRGLGVLAVTDQAVLFGSGTGRVVLMSRDGLQVDQVGSGLVITGTEPAQEVTLAMADPQSVVAALS